MKLHANETVVASHPMEVETDGRVSKILLVTSFGRMFIFWPTSGGIYALLNDSLAS